ncbi:hypothetical protein Naga_102855g1, partial [Nannochloropsis gaditana]
LLRGCCQRVSPPSRTPWGPLPSLPPSLPSSPQSHLLPYFGDHHSHWISGMVAMVVFVLPLLLTSFCLLSVRFIFKLRYEPDGFGGPVDARSVGLNGLWRKRVPCCYFYCDILSSI